MTKEARVTFLALLSVGLYTLSCFISYLKVIFPYPLFGPILWIVTLSTFIIQLKQKTLKEYKFGAIFFLLYIHLKLFSNPFVLSFFLHDNEMEAYFENPYLNLSKLLAYIVLSLSLLCWFASKTKRKFVWVLTVLILALIIQLIDDSYAHLWFCPLIVIPFYLVKPENPWKNVILIHSIFDLITLFYMPR